VDPEIGPMQIQFALFGGISMTSIFIVMGRTGLVGGQVRAFLGNSKVDTRLAHRIAGIVRIGLGLWRGFQSKSYDLI
jgi:threonine/homoserine/homoserine lactone efflux protein